jgi:hypothetical protein
LDWNAANANSDLDADRWCYPDAIPNANANSDAGSERDSDPNAKSDAVARLQSK